MCASIAFVIFTFGLNVNTLLPGRFELNGQNHQVSVNVNVLIEMINTLGEWLDQVSSAAVNEDVTETLCDALEQALLVTPLPHNGGNNEEFHENLAVMLIDGSLSLGDNPLITSNEFNRRNITLVVVAVATPSHEVWDYYRQLARNTGGEYMLLADASDILRDVILSVINGEDTLRQAFFHIGVENVPFMVNHIGDMNEQNQTTDGVNDLSFDHGSSD